MATKMLRAVVRIRRRSSVSRRGHLGLHQRPPVRVKGLVERRPTRLQAVHAGVGGQIRDGGRSGFTSCEGGG
jgi:hypothetical protein